MEFYFILYLHFLVKTSLPMKLYVRTFYCSCSTSLFKLWRTKLFTTRHLVPHCIALLALISLSRQR